MERWAPESPQKLDTPLARLCRFYLDCLNQDDQGGLSVFASSQFELDYVELQTLPLLADAPDEIFGDEAGRRLLNKTKRDRSRLNLVLGYPVRLSKVRGRRGWEGYVVEPILLFPYHEDPMDRYATPTLSDELPQINSKALRSLTAADSASIVEEIVQLSEELGLANVENELPELDEIIARLRAVRPEWDWKEQPDPYRLVQNPGLSDIKETGIYNRAVLLAAERSPYTRGLETELAILQAVPESKYSNTALGAWVSGTNIFQQQSVEATALLEVLPLNSEQRQAVLQGLTNPLAVITGPPGTGKSQVVTSLLINAAWQSKTVLFASKNNKAVDVVETRINALGPRPILLRLGANEYQTRLAEYLIALLAASVSPDDERQYKDLLSIHERLRQRSKELEVELGETIRIRNMVDRLEQEVEPIRKLLGDERFRSFKNLAQRSARVAIRALKGAVRRADCAGQLFVRRLFLGLIKNRWYRTAAGKVCDYFKHLGQLNAAKPLEQISRERHTLVDELAEESESLWKMWLRLQPKRMSQENRRLLREYSSLLQMIVASNESGGRLGSQVFKRYHTLFPQITNILSC